MPPDSVVPEKGYLSFVNNTVDANTGTIQLMGTFANTDHHLWPGQYSNVLLRMGEQQNVMLVPSEAVQSAQQGQFAFIVRLDMTVDVPQVMELGAGYEGIFHKSNLTVGIR